MKNANKNAIKTVTVELPAYWAGYLINNNAASLEDSVEDVKAALAEAGVRSIDCLTVSDESFTGRFNGLVTELSTYTFVLRA